MLKLLDKVFAHKKNEKVLIIYDVPNENDNEEWRLRREIAYNWYLEYMNNGISVKLAEFCATFKNNTELPKTCVIDAKEQSIESVLKDTNIVLALTEYSATAPLHRFAKKYNLRIASMPGFNKAMLPALELDLDLVAKKVNTIYQLLLKTNSIEIIFSISDRVYPLFLDLEGSKPRKDDANCTIPGTVINLPSGEAFIVPKEIRSKSNGFLPIQVGDTINVYHISDNRIVDADFNDELMYQIYEDPSVGNIAEVAFGVLGLFGIKSCGKILQDEKLGIHIALGRSDHLGGNVGSDSFEKLTNVWHEDYIFIKELQPKINVRKVVFYGEKEILVMENNEYKIF